MRITLVVLVTGRLGYQDCCVQPHYPRHAPQKSVLGLHFTALAVVATQFDAIRNAVKYMVLLPHIQVTGSLCISLTFFSVHHYNHPPNQHCTILAAQKISNKPSDNVRFEPFMAVTIKNAVSRDVTLRGSCKNQCFGRTFF
jgi:hypothetical protein